MTVHSAPLDETVTTLRSGQRNVTEYAADLYDRIESLEPDVQAWMSGPKSQEWFEAEASALAERYPDPANRPALYGVPVGVKDIFHVDGMPTRGGSDLPPGELASSQAAVVTALREAGALVLGKTVTTEFAYFEPGPTRNPHNLDHTPGGSSSGSAAAVAAGMCPLALGTQTIGSVIRPATFCGIVGFKPSLGRIPLEGVIPLSPSLDQVGLFTQNIAGMELAASVCVEGWEASSDSDIERPVLGVPNDEYLSQVSDVGLECFEDQVDTLESAGYEIRRVRAFEDIDAINERHNRLVAADAALAHHEWFSEYADQYANSTAELLREGQEVSVKPLADARRGRLKLRNALEDRMAEHGIDVWISPGAPGPAPEGIETTGDPIMNLPWTHAGVPAVGVPAGQVDGLPVGLQCTTQFENDERLLAWADSIADNVAA